MKSFKQQCIELRQKDHTLNEIVEITGRSKTTVYFHIKDVPLSKKKIKEISENSRQAAIKLARSRKGKALRPFKPFKKWTPKMVLLIGHLMFDGEIARGRCVYNNRSSLLIKRVQKLMKLVYDFPGGIRIKDGSEVCVISFNNVELETFLQEKTLELLKGISGMPKLFQKELLRAFFDDEGCMNYNAKSNTRRIRGYQNNKEILILIQKLLINFSIESRLQSSNEVVITGKENLIKFQKEINFSKGVRINPNRTNSLWKKNLEKRKLLDMAIKSFKT